MEPNIKILYYITNLSIQGSIKYTKIHNMDYKQVMNKDDFSPFESNPILFEKII